MTLTVRLPPRVQQELAEYCVKRSLTKSEAVKRALEDLLRQSRDEPEPSNHPFIGVDKGDGSDVSGSIKQALRSRFGKRRR